MCIMNELLRESKTTESLIVVQLDVSKAFDSTQSQEMPCGKRGYLS